MKHTNISKIGHAKNQKVHIFVSLLTKIYQVSNKNFINSDDHMHSDGYIQVLEAKIVFSLESLSDVSITFQQDSATCNTSKSGHHESK
ncbi:MAG: hypothetical protein MHMPM18_002141 [Marteilia pararefringens]